MTPETFIAQSIFRFPTLYFRNDIEKSKIRVLDHAFLVIGNGIEFKNGSFSWSHSSRSDKDRKKQKFNKETKKRVLSGEKIVTVYNYTQHPDGLEHNFQRMSEMSKASEYTAFLSDLDMNCYIDYEVAIKLKELPPNTKGVFDDGQRDYISYDYKPYPFSIEYTPFWNREKKAFIPKDDIKKYWRDSIIFIYQKALEWFSDDKKFFADDYYNWLLREDSKKQFLDNWNKEPNKVKLCSDYGIKLFDYTDMEQMIKAIIKHRQQEYISNAKKVIDFYS